MSNRPPAIAARPAIAEDLFCQNCGYNLRGLTGDICPECGNSLASVRSDICNIPWVHRKQLGWWRAYWKTIWLVMFRQRQFAEEMARPVGYRDSQSFRWISVGLVALPVLAALAATYVFNPPRRVDWLWETLAYADVWPMAIVYACFVLFLAAATGLPSYFFQPKDIPIAQRNRAIALSYYACGPLAVLFVPLACYIMGLAFMRSDEKAALLVFLLGALLPCGQLYAWWADLIHLSRRLTPQRPRTAGVMVLLPALWLAAAFLIVVVLPLCLFVIVGVFLSLA
jgi:hypothetical protein